MSALKELSYNEEYELIAPTVGLTIDQFNNILNLKKDPPKAISPEEKNDIPP